MLDMILNNHHSTHKAMYITSLLYLRHVSVMTNHLLGECLNKVTKYLYFYFLFTVHYGNINHLSTNNCTIRINCRSVVTETYVG
jgi:hypothetical protein